MCDNCFLLVIKTATTLSNSLFTPFHCESYKYLNHLKYRQFFTAIFRHLNKVTINAMAKTFLSIYAI